MSLVEGKIRGENLAMFTAQYFERLQEAAAKIDPDAFEKIKDVFMDAYKKGKRFYTMGNGGSAAIADHFLCDLSKGTHVAGRSAFKSICLSDNTGLMTAIGNDIGYDQIFSKQLEYNLEPGDVCVMISSSGSSSNVVKACELAKSKGAITVALVGFEGGKLKEMADHVLWVPIKNYGIAEDVHQSIMHILTQFISS